MLHTLSLRRDFHLGFTLMAFLGALALSLMAIFGTIFTDNKFLILLPLGFMCFVSALIGFLLLAEHNPSHEKSKNFISIQLAALLFAALLLPLALYFVKG